MLLLIYTNRFETIIIITNLVGLKNVKYQHTAQPAYFTEGKLRREKSEGVTL
jgi:hypothetical protein